MKQFYTFWTSPIGRLLLTSDGSALTGLYTGRPNEEATPDDDWQRDDAAFPFAQTKKQLTNYFSKRLKSFDLPIKLIGTEFQKSVWKELTKIPHGTLVSYGDIARKIKNPKAVRAVGGAVGSNPISIIVPCHRVIGASSTLTGYFGGLPRKKVLLALEESLDNIRSNV